MSAKSLRMIPNASRCIAVWASSRSGAAEPAQAGGATMDAAKQTTASKAQMWGPRRRRMRCLVSP